jgi:hypothetical protein
MDLILLPSNSEDEHELLLWGGLRLSRLGGPSKSGIVSRFEITASADGTHKAMNDIRYVCLSDLHLGAENSILTRLTSVSHSAVELKADPTTASEVMVQLVNCLRRLISQNDGPQKPTLILNGDVLELALADINVAVMVFERFMELTMKPGEELFDKKIYYNPGNHDHHVWETARETQYIEKYLSSTKWGDHLDTPWHTTNMFLEEYDPVPCYLLDTLMNRYEPK